MEGFGFCLLGIVCVLSIVVIGAFGVSLAATVSGLAGSVAFKGRGCLGRASTGLMVIGVAMLALLAGGLWWAFRTTQTPMYSLTDAEIAPYLLALNHVEAKRSGLGFTPIPIDAQIQIEMVKDDRNHDVYLHVYAETSRTITFKQEGDSYVWIGEHEIYLGPNEYETADGALREMIEISYDAVNGWPSDTVFILYRGDDIRLSGMRLTLQDVQPILEEWESLRTPASDP